MANSKPRFVFFGTPELVVTVLEELEKSGFLPDLIVTQEDKPQGRHLEMTPPPVKIWAEKKNIRVLQPKSLRDGEVANALKVMAPESGPASSQGGPASSQGEWDVFIVTAYGKILPKEILSIPNHGILNMHPSLLPRLRGASPIQGAILAEEKTGVSIMKLDEEMDHGPIIAQKEVLAWSDLNQLPYEPELENLLAKAGGALLAEVLPKWIAGGVAENPQDHSKATFTSKIEKRDAEIKLSDSPETNLRKIRAFSRWPKAYTYIETKHGLMRVIITRASIKEGVLDIEKVIPEGRKEMTFEDFRRGFL
jgi:methionyl-tRNA formyltransferase